MNFLNRSALEVGSRTRLSRALSCALSALLGAMLLSASVAEAQGQDTVFMGPCTGPMIEGQCPIYNTDSRSATLGSTSFFGRIFSEIDTFYFDNPYPNADITVTVTVNSGPNLDIVGLGAPPAPNTYGPDWRFSQGARRSHTITVRNRAGRYQVRVGENYLSGPGITSYTVSVRVTQVLANPIPLPPRLVVNDCRPPMDLGLFTSGGGTANFRTRGPIAIGAGDFDCYEFDVQFNGPKFSALFGMTWFRFVLNDLPSTGTKNLLVYDMDRGRFPYVWRSQATSMTQYAQLLPGRYRIYVIAGSDAFTSSSYRWQINTY